MPTHYDARFDSDVNSRDGNHRDHEDSNSDGRDREISLGTGTVLAIFLGLALICSLFFGLGYSMGKKSTPLIPLAAAAPSATSIEESGKPSSGSPAAAHTSSSSARPGLQVAQPSEEAPTGSAAVTTAPSSRTVLLRTDRSPGPGASTVTEASAPSLPVAGPQSFVQIAAVSRREDADLLLAALKHRGYTGLVRQQPQDKLLHIQVGPFPSKKEAEPMRQRLIVDGYNPIIK